MAGSRKFKMYPPVSKASKPKAKGWDRVSRFMMGHDAGCMALLPEELTLAEIKPTRPRTMKTQTWRAATFAMTREQRVIDDALFLVNRGYEPDLELALEKALKNNPGSAKE